MKQRIRLTESDLHKIVKESVKRIINEVSEISANNTPYGIVAWVTDNDEDSVYDYSRIVYADSLEELEHHPYLDATDAVESVFALTKEGYDHYRMFIGREKDDEELWNELTSEPAYSIEI